MKLSTYPSINYPLSEKLLKDSLTFAKKHIPVRINDLKIIQHSRKSLSYKKGEPWVKKVNDEFDAMVYYKYKESIIKITLDYIGMMV